MNENLKLHRAEDGSVWREVTSALLVMTYNQYGRLTGYPNSASRPRADVLRLHGELTPIAD